MGCSINKKVSACHSVSKVIWKYGIAIVNYTSILFICIHSIFTDHLDCSLDCSICSLSCYSVQKYHSSLQWRNGKHYLTDIRLMFYFRSYRMHKQCVSVITDKSSHNHPGRIQSHLTNGCENMKNFGGFTKHMPWSFFFFFGKFLWALLSDILLSY